MATVIDLSARRARSLAYRVGSFILDPYRQLSTNGTPIQIGRKSLDILSVLAEAKGALVTKDEMMAAVWPKAIVEENAIQAQIVGLRKILGSDADLLSTVRGYGYRLAITPEPSAPDAKPPPAVPVPAARPRILWIALAVTLAIAIATSCLALLDGRGAQVSGSGGDRIAVMPLAIRGGGAAADSFVAGLSDKIGSAFSDVHVPIVPDTDALKSSRVDAPSRPNADLLIDGTVEGDGDNLQVLVRLNDIREHVIVWSAAFQGPASSPEALQVRVAARVANIAKWADIGRSGHVKLNAAALAAFIAGRENTTAIRDNADNSDLPFYQKVVANAPDFSLGHSSVAAALAAEALDQPAPLAARLRQESGREARRAMTLDPKNGEPFVALELAMPVSDWAGREDLLLRGAAVDPGYEPGIMMEARLLWATGRGHEAVDWLERAQSLNRLHPGQTSTLVLLLASEGNVAESRALLSRMRAEWPDLSWTEHVGFWAPLVEGSTAEVLALLTDPKTQPDDMPLATLKAWRTALTGILADDRATKAHAARSTVDAVRAGWLYPGVAMLLLARLGDVDGAFRIAETYQPRGPTEQPYLFLPPTASLRADPRFMKVAQRLGLVAYWRRTGHWPDFCGEPGLRYDCRVEAARIGA